MLVTRIATCMRAGQPYQLRDTDGTAITESEGRAIVKHRYQLDPRQRDHVRHKLMRERRKGRARSHRSRHALQHPSPPNPSLRANTSLDSR